MASFVYTTGRYQMMNKAIGCIGDTFKVILVSSAPTDANGSTNTYSLGAFSGELSTANGYTQGGMTLAGTLSLDIGAAPTVKWKTSADSTWTNASFTTVGAVIYHSSTNYLICYCDFGGSKTGGGGNFTCQFSGASNGIVEITS